MASATPRIVWEASHVDYAWPTSTSKANAISTQSYVLEKNVVTENSLSPDQKILINTFREVFPKMTKVEVIKTPKVKKKKSDDDDEG